MEEAIHQDITLIKPRVLPPRAAAFASVVIIGGLAGILSSILVGSPSTHAEEEACTVYLLS